MKARIRDSLLALVLVVAAWSPVEAQERPSSVFPAPGAEVRGQIRTGTGETAFEGFLISSSPSELEIRTRESESLRIESASLAALEVNRGRSAGAGAGNGWKIGAVTLGLPLGLLVAGEADSPGVGFLYGAVVGGLAGSLVGAVFGAAIGADSWERVW